MRNWIVPVRFRGPPARGLFYECGEAPDPEGVSALSSDFGRNWELAIPAHLGKPCIVRGLLGTGAPDPTLESASPSSPQGSIWHRNRVKSGNRCRIDAESTPEEARARRIRGWGPGGLCLISPSHTVHFLQEVLSVILRGDFAAEHSLLNEVM